VTITNLVHYYFQKFRSNNFTLYLTLNLNKSEKKLQNKLIKESNRIKTLSKNMSIKCIPILFDFIENEKKNIQSFEKLEFEAHSNLLLYRPSKFTIEWFEPHGTKFYSKDSKSKINEKLQELIEFFTNQLNTKKEERIQIIYPDIVCPNIYGLQRLEEQSLLEEISDGYCALWSLLIMKLALKYNYKSLSEIVSEILALYKTADELRMLMYSFSKEVNLILKKNYNTHLGQDETQQRENVVYPENIPESSQYSYSHTSN
jgi:hypothetical protein